jgi:hypothetical protein
MLIVLNGNVVRGILQAKEKSNSLLKFKKRRKYIIEENYTNN